MALLRRLFRRGDARPASNGHAEAIEQEQARIVARLEAMQIRVDVPTRRAGDDRRQEGERGSVSR